MCLRRTPIWWCRCGSGEKPSCSEGVVSGGRDSEFSVGVGFGAVDF
jgi:hypothetical protein